MRSLSVDRIHRPTARAFRSTYLKAVTPVIITGVADRWPAVRDWSHERLERRCGPPPDASRYIVRKSVAALPPDIRTAVRPLDAYMGSESLLPRSLDPIFKDGERLWIGPAGTVSSLHFDLGHNLFTQIVGRKRFRLFAPSQSALLHYPDFMQPAPQFAAIDVEDPDHVRYPRFREACAIEVELQPGEILFLPQLWWHHVRALDPSVSLSSLWVTPTLLLRQRGYWYQRAKRVFVSAFDEARATSAAWTRVAIPHLGS